MNSQIDSYWHLPPVSRWLSCSVRQVPKCHEKEDKYRNGQGQHREPHESLGELEFDRNIALAELLLCLFYLLDQTLDVIAPLLVLMVLLVDFLPPGKHEMRSQPVTVSRCLRVT